MLNCNEKKNLYTYNNRKENNKYFKRGILYNTIIESNLNKYIYIFLNRALVIIII